MSGRVVQWRLSEQAVYRRLDDREAVVLDLRTQRYFGLDAVGARLWELLADDGLVESVVAALLGEFEVDEGTLRADVDRFLDDLAREGLIAPGVLPSAHSPRASRP